MLIKGQKRKKNIVENQGNIFARKMCASQKLEAIKTQINLGFSAKKYFKT